MPAAIARLVEALRRAGAAVEARAPAGLVVRLGREYARAVVDARGRVSIIVPAPHPTKGACRAEDACRMLGVPVSLRVVDGALIVVGPTGSLDDDRLADEVARALVEAWRAALPNGADTVDPPARPAFPLDVVDD